MYGDYVTLGQTNHQRFLLQYDLCQHSFEFAPAQVFQFQYRITRCHFATSHAIFDTVFPDQKYTTRGNLSQRSKAVGSKVFDHRIIDGAPAAKFLQYVKQVVEEPYLLLAA